MGLDDWLEAGTVFDWVSPLLHLAQNATGKVTFGAYPAELVELDRAGVSYGAPVLDHDSGAYVVTIRKADLPKARRVLARARARGW